MARTPFECHTHPVGKQGFAVELEREDDGRWIAEVPSLPGVMVYAQTRDEAMARVEALALRVLADRLEHGETVPEVTRLFFAAA
jgi:predicted RNase H-like HicB family nuclease